MAEQVTLRAKRQITLPAEICQALGISVGDQLEIWLEGEMLMARPKRAVAREALRELREVLAESGVSEEELEEHARGVRYRLRAERRGGQA